MVRVRRDKTYPCPDAWNRSHCSCVILPSKIFGDTLPSGSYLSTRYVTIALDSLWLHPVQSHASADTTSCRMCSASHQMMKSLFS